MAVFVVAFLTYYNDSRTLVDFIANSIDTREISEELDPVMVKDFRPLSDNYFVYDSYCDDRLNCYKNIKIMQRDSEKLNL